MVHNIYQESPQHIPSGSTTCVHNIYCVFHNMYRVVHNIYPQHVSSDPQHVPTAYISQSTTSPMVLWVTCCGLQDICCGQHVTYVVDDMIVTHNISFSCCPQHVTHHICLGCCPQHIPVVIHNISCVLHNMFFKGCGRHRCGIHICCGRHLICCVGIHYSVLLRTTDFMLWVYVVDCTVVEDIPVVDTIYMLWVYVVDNTCPLYMLWVSICCG